MLAVWLAEAKRVAVLLSSVYARESKYASNVLCVQQRQQWQKQRTNGNEERSMAK